MKKMIFIILLGCVVTKAQIFTVKIEVIVKDFKEDSRIFITGNNPTFGNWQSADVPLNQKNDSVFVGRFEFQKDEIIEFKFTKGSWETEALTDKKNIPQNYVYKVVKDTLLSFRILYWRDETPLEGGFIGQVTGRVDHYPNFEGEGILPRDVHVWLPPDYDLFQNKRFSVLYMHDGQNLFDPSTSYTGIDWQVDEAADSLIQNEIIESIIVVGINNSSQRSADYSPGTQGEAYINFVVNVLKPFIDSTYRTKLDRESTAVGGSSMGGLISFMMVWQRHDIFSKAICMSPAFVYKDFNYVKNIESYSGDKKNILLYIDNGGVGLEERLQPGIDAMLKVLKNIGYITNKDLFWVLDTSAFHTEAAWAERIPAALEILFGRKTDQQ
jgi:predicted alpha/beta superfamily hydrolase